jgi:hypothetical protein
MANDLFTYLNNRKIFHFAEIFYLITLIFAIQNLKRLIW